MERNPLRCDLCMITDIVLFIDANTGTTNFAKATIHHSTTDMLQPTTTNHNQPQPPPQPQPPGACFVQGGLVVRRVSPACRTLRLAMMAGRDVGGVGNARRRRGRRLRAMLRHEQQSIAMALATVTHHSTTLPRWVPRTTAYGHRRQSVTSAGGKRPAPLADVAGPQEAAVTVGYGVPSLAVPALADSTADGLDSPSSFAALWKRRRGRKRR